MPYKDPLKAREAARIRSARYHLTEKGRARKRRYEDAQRHPRDRVAEFWARVEKTETCWLWLGTVDRQGYGRTGSAVSRLTHRKAWVLTFGPIPPGLTIDHLCRVVRCVNPAHMEIVTRQENMRRAVEARRTVVGR